MWCFQSWKRSILRLWCYKIDHEHFWAISLTEKLKNKGNNSRARCYIRIDRSAINARAHGWFPPLKVNNHKFGQKCDKVHRRRKHRNLSDLQSWPKTTSYCARYWSWYCISWCRNAFHSIRQATSNCSKQPWRNWTWAQHSKKDCWDVQRWNLCFLCWTRLR